MTSPAACHKCQREFSALRIGLHWPTKIACKSCGSAHCYRFGHVIGVLYLLFLLPSLVIPLIYSGNFANVENGIYKSNFMGFLVHLGGVIVVLLIGGFLFGTIMKKFFLLRSRNS